MSGGPLGPGPGMPPGALGLRFVVAVVAVGLVLAAALVVAIQW